MQANTPNFKRPEKNRQAFRLKFKYLPLYARFILNNFIDEFVIESIKMAQELDVPVLKYYDHLSKEDMKKISTLSTSELLGYLADDKAEIQIDEAVKRWMNNQLPKVEKDQVVAEDITLISYIRKQALLRFLPQYTCEQTIMFAIITEIDQYISALETASINTFSRLMETRINEQLMFIEKINNTSPGVIYVYDLEKNTILYSNWKIKDVLGYKIEELNKIGDSLLSYLQHPDDIEKVNEHFVLFETAEDNEIRTITHRMLHKNGTYRWIKNFESIFKRNTEGKPTQIIGISLDVDGEMKISEQLLRSEEQLLQAQELAGIGSFEWNLNTLKGSITPQIYKILELDDLDDMNNFALHINPADSERVRDITKVATENKSIYDYECRYLTKSGEKTIWARGDVSLLNGNLIVKGTIMDVSERYKMVKRLQESEELYKEAQALTHIGNWTWNIKKNKITWSDELFRIYDMEPQSEEITMEKFQSHIHPDDREMRLKQIEDELNTMQPSEYFFRIISDKNKVKTLHGISEIKADRNGKPIKMFGTVQDVTEQKLIEKELAEQEHFIKHIAEASPTILYLYDLEEKRFLYINKEVKEVMGYEPEEILEIGADSSKMFIHPDDDIKSQDKYVKYAHAGGSTIMHQFEGRVKHKNNNWKWLLTREIVFKRDEQGKALQVLGSALDITDRKEMEQALKYKTLQLQQSNSSLEEFAHIASHDLQEPLRKISTFGDRLITSNKENLSEDGLRYLEKIVLSTKRMQQLINDILSISLLSGIKVFEQYDLNKLLEEVLQTLEFKIDITHTRIDIDPLPELKIIPSQFRQLFQNLLSNSIKFSKPGISPKIKITSQIIQKSEVIKYKLQNASQYIKITVEDNGIGFEDYYADQIFAIFQRLNGRSEYEGTGIGLAICKKIVENHGGIIFAIGEVNEGAAFTIVLPDVS